MKESTVDVVGYVRVSTDGQAKHGYSLEEQKEEIKKYCNVQNYNLLEIFSDEGISGAQVDEDEMTLSRDGLLDMLVYVKEMGVQYIVVLSTASLGSIRYTTGFSGRKRRDSRRAARRHILR